MTNEEHKIEFQLLKDNLVNNYVIYHERVTLLLQLSLFDIKDTEVIFKAKEGFDCTNARNCKFARLNFKLTLK